MTLKFPLTGSDRPRNEPARTDKKAVHPDPYKRTAIGVGVVFALILPWMFVVVILAPATPPTQTWDIHAAALGVDSLEIARGEAVYRNTCLICHGPSGEGVPQLGKPLRNSAYIQNSTDEELFRIVAEGRMPNDPANTTGTLMPARGARGMSDEQIWAVVYYMRTMQDADAPVIVMDEWVREQMPAVADNGPDLFAVLKAHPGHELYQASCSACHGDRGQGMESLGLPLVNSGFVIGATDKELVTFTKMGRPIWDANNQTGIDMPPRGGNPALGDSDIELIVEYIRELQDASSGAPSAEAVSIAQSSESVDFTKDPALEAARQAYLASCSACHGQRGEGMTGLGTPLAGSSFLQSKSDSALATFIKTGRSPWDPDSQTGMDMPARGGNPALSDDDLALIIAYLRAMQTKNISGGSD